MGTACVAVYTRPGSDDYVMVFGSRQELYSVQSCSYRDPSTGAPIWDQDPNGEDATCFTKVQPAPTPALAVSFVETPMKRSCYLNCVCTAGLTMYQDVWQCLIFHKDDSTGAQVAKAACSNLTACVAVYTRPGVDDYVNGVRLQAGVVQRAVVQLQGPRRKRTSLEPGPKRR